MKLDEWKRNLLERTKGQIGDLKVDPSFDVKPDSIDALLDAPSCHDQIPYDNLEPDYENQDPLRNVRPGSPREHA